MHFFRFQLKSFRNLRLRLEVLRWKFACATFLSANPEADTYLVATSVGGNLNVIALDIVIAQALKSRGHNVKLLLCDGSLSACMNCELNKFTSAQEFVELGPRKLCISCRNLGVRIASQHSLEIIALGSIQGSGKLTSPEDSSFESAVAGAKRFLGSGSEEATDEFKRILKRFVNAALEVESNFAETLNTVKIKAVIAHHGIYVPQGNIVKICRDRRIPVVTWNQAYRRGSYLFSLNDTYHKTLLEEFEWDRPLTNDQKISIENYLLSRDSGENDWIRFGTTTRSKSSNYIVNFPLHAYDLLLTNVSWDAQVHYESNIFYSMFEWLRITIIWYKQNPSQNLIIRVHPAEKTGLIVSQEPVSEWIRREFGDLPKNIQLIDALDKVSTYLLIKNSRLGLIYATKTGIEMAAAGKAVVVAGESWIRNKGFAYEPSSNLEYIDLLNKNASLDGLPEIDRNKALRFAYYFFFDRMIQINSIKPLKYYPYARPMIGKNWEKSDPGLLHVISKIEKGENFN